MNAKHKKPETETETRNEGEERMRQAGIKLHPVSIQEEGVCLSERRRSKVYNHKLRIKGHTGLSNQ